MGLRVVLMLVETFGGLGPALVEELRKASPVRQFLSLFTKPYGTSGKEAARLGGACSDAHDPNCECGKRRYRYRFIERSK